MLKFTWQTELACDCAWCIQIVLGFITAFYLDADLVIDLKLIALKHLRETLIYDLISTLPCMITFYGLQIGDH